MDRKDMKKGSRNENVPDNLREIEVETAEEKNNNNHYHYQHVKIMKKMNVSTFVPSHDPGFSVKVATSRGLSSFKTPNRMLYSPVTVETAKA